jgi:hypothetical protein
MADEIRIDGSMQLSDSEDSEESLQVAELMATMATLKWIKQKISVGTSEEAIPLGEVTSPGWAIFINRDTTNFINLKVATSGAIFAKLLAGEFALLRLGSGAQAPYAIADTAACKMEYFIAMT